MNLQFSDGNQLQLLNSGSAYFPALITAIDAAQIVVYLETYIFAGDETGRAVVAALVRAAGRGVAVHLLVDGFGSKDMPAPMRQELLDAKVQVLLYNPKISPFALQRRSLRRMHRKLAVIDRRLALVGGINIIDDIVTSSHPHPRCDYAISIEGPLVVTIEAEAVRLWRRVAWVNFRWRWRHKEFVPASTVLGKQRAALVVRDNLLHRFNPA